MSDWQSLLQRKHGTNAGVIVDSWFAQIACRILNGSRLVVADERYRVVEIEFYYSSEDHPDPFAHRDPLQLECGRWYFHRTGGTYRSGSFKGLDLTFGDGKAFGGILIRSIAASDGSLTDGPSLCVDHLLASYGAKFVAELDEAIHGRTAWDADNPLRLSTLATTDQRQVVLSARVGLSLKRVGGSPDPPHYIMRPYRFLTEPRRVRKGKLNLVLALHGQGVALERIREVTGCPRKSIRRYIAEFEAGQKEADFTPFIGIDLRPQDLCRLHGVWHSTMQLSNGGS